MAFLRPNKQNDLFENDTLNHCLQNLKFKIKNNYNVSEANLSHIGASDISDASIEKRNLMQWAIMRNNAHNVKMLFPFFEPKTYLPTLQNVSEDVRENMSSLIGALLEKSSQERKAAIKHYNSLSG